jgi:plasmid segregation protein ParM
MTDNLIVGLDVGYGQCKAMLETGNSVCFPSLVAPAEFIRFQTDVGMPSTSNGLTLHDTCEGALFIGELAARQGRPGATRSPRDRDRVTDPIMTHLMDAALASVLTAQDDVHVNVVTGLPVDYFKDAHQLAGHLRGRHTIKLEKRTLTVDVQDVLVVPQPFGALLSILLDEQGNLMPDVGSLVEGRVGVLDIGTYTTDLILVDRLEYIEAGSGSLEVGVSTVLEMLRKVLLDDHRISYEAHQLEEALRRGWLLVDGQRVTLNGLASEHFGFIAQSIDARARTLWNIGTLSAVILAGGGVLALQPWLEPRFNRAIYPPDAVMANVTGFLRYGLRRWR